jgi:8-amino-7-oxononanoate synthase
MVSTQKAKRTSLMIEAALAERALGNRERKLRYFTPLDGMECLIDGERFINFGSNDYLGLSSHPYLKERSMEFTEHYGAGSTGSRLISGNLSVYEEIEQKLADLKGTEASLIFCSGYQLNSTVLECIGQIGSAIFCDRLSHSSILMGVQSSGLKFSRFRHNDMIDLEQKVRSVANSEKAPWVVTETVFGMDGDVCPLDELTAKSRQYEFELFVDEAHAMGVLGVNGMGMAAKRTDIAIMMGTFSKGCGAFGGYIACSAAMKKYLLNFCSGMVYSTGLPPAALGAIDAALHLIPQMSEERRHLMGLATNLRIRLHELGFEVGASETQIVPIIVGSDKDVLSLSRYLENKGIFAPAIRPPTVPQNTARIRISLSAKHTEEQVETLLDALKSWRDGSK